MIFLEAVIQRCSVKTVFLEISQNSQENTCARVSFLKSESQIPKKLFFSCFNESPLKMMKNTFYFILKTLPFSKYLNFCLVILVM